MNTAIEYRDLGLIDYKEAWDYQEALFDTILQAKQGRAKEYGKGHAKEAPASTSNYLLFCEHPAVFTIGKSGGEANLLLNAEQLEKKNISYYKINRGGDITYHGPGQIVGYPIVDLENFSLGIKKYIELLEEAIILTLHEYGIRSERLPGATGAWIDTHDQARARKICAIGVRASKYITMHGFAFNVNTDLSYYNYINPCGFTDKGVTSMEKELGARQDIGAVKSKLKHHLARLLGGSLT